MTRRHHILLSLILLNGATLRFWHLDWGTDPGDGRFHPLHPNERSLLQAAAELRHDLKPTISSYGALSLYLPWLPATLFCCSTPWARRCRSEDLPVSCFWLGVTPGRTWSC